MTGKETKIFDPADGFAPLTNAMEITDSTVIKRGNRWWMYLAGEAQGHEGIQLFSASLPEGSPLSVRGWALTPEPNDPARIALLAGHEASKAWDLKGGRHCPSYICAAEIHSARRGLSGSIIPAAQKIFGDRTRLAIWSGMADGGLISRSPYSWPARIGSMEVSMNLI